MKHACTAVALAFALGFAGAAQAFCRTSTCASCPRDPDTGCTVGGELLAWPGACTSFSMSEAAPQSVELERATALMREAFATWENARCADDAAQPAIAVSDAFGPAQCDLPEYNPHHGNANLIVFRDDAWPYKAQTNALAATSLSFTNAGEIYDADMEINATGPLSLPPESAELAFGVIPGQHDLLSLMLHEAGHFLGLDHSREEGSVMQAELAAGEVRTQLSPDDEAAICAAYPPERAALACDFAPRGGFASACAPAPDAGGCSVQARPRASSVPGLACLVLACLARRRKGAR